MGLSPQLSHATPWCTCLVLESPPEKAVFLAWPLLWMLLLPPVFWTFLMAIPASTGDKKMSPYNVLPQRFWLWSLSDSSSTMCIFLRA